MENKEYKSHIGFKLFGGSLTYQYGEEGNWVRMSEAFPAGVGKKLSAFLEYLILNHDKVVSSEELIRVFWPEDRSTDPGNALKYTMHKTRGLLKKMFPEEDGLLLTQQGHYTWNPNVKIYLDTEEFERICLQARAQHDVAAFEALMEAIDLYSGDILTNCDEEWILPLRTYFRTLYIDGCKSVLTVLNEQNRWMDIIRICERAYQLEPLAEEFTLHMMTALIAINQARRAIERYEAYRSILWNELNLIPSEEMELVHSTAIEQTNADEQDLIQMMVDEELDKSAFLCSFNVFRSIVSLEMRHMLRNKTEATMLIVKAGAEPGKNTPSTTDVRRVERVLLRTLRSGDPVARLNAGSYIVLLSGASEENAQTVMHRIERAFRTSYPRSKARLSCKIYPLTLKTLSEPQA